MSVLETVQDERAKRLKRIRQISIFMKWALTAVIALLAVAGIMIVLSVLLPGHLEFAAEETLDAGNIERALVDIPLGQRIALSVMVTFAFGVLIIISWQIRQLFDHYSRTDFFSPRTLSRIVSLGWWLLVIGVYDFVSDPIGSIIATIDLPTGQKAMEISLDGGELLFLIFGTLMILFGWIMREAASIDEENRQFV